jgi:hypothetical protein
MKKVKLLVVVPLMALIMTIAFMGGNWSNTSAKSTVPHNPEESPTSTSVAQGGEGWYNGCNPSSIDVGPARKGAAGCLPWEAFIPVGSACVDGIVAVYDHEIVGNSPPPSHWKMINYGSAFEVRFYVKGLLVKDPTCADYNVRYYLNAWQRSVYDKTPEQIGIYSLDPATNLWQDCKATLDDTLGTHGVLTCSIKTWGFYALGHPSVYNK